MWFLKSFRLSFLSLLCTGCSFFVPNPPCPPPPSAKAPITFTYSCNQQTVPLVIPDKCEKLVLVDLVDIALQNSPKTRAAWFQAKNAAGDVGIARGAYLPPIIFNGQYLNQNFLEITRGIELTFRQTTYGPSVSTSYLLFDFGGRNGNLQQALAALNALNWIFNWEIQTVMITTIQNYYNYLNAVAIVKANEEAVQDYQTTVEASTALKLGGVKSLADELQARTSLVQAQINLEHSRANMDIARANLVRSLALPADTPINVVDLPESIDTSSVCDDAALILKAAKENRADLKALRATVLQNRGKIRSARSQFYPNFTTDGSVGKEWINGLGPKTVYALQLNLNYTPFNSFIDLNNLKKAEAQWQNAQAQLDDQELQAFLAVLTDYYDLMANTQILNFSRNYIDIATKNRDVAFANYKGGVNTIIDLMTANNALHIARIQLANAKTSWLTALADLAYDTGGLEIDSIDTQEKVTPTLIEHCCEEVCDAQPD